MRRRTGGLAEFVNPIVLTGLALSVASSAALDLTGAASGVESLLACLLGAAITLILDSTARAEARFELRGSLESADWLRGEVRSLAASVREITERHPAPEISAETLRRFVQLRVDLDDLRQGRIIRPGADAETLLSATTACRDRLEAVTNVPGAGPGARWWHSPLGRRYWEANLAALARGVSITRVFICDGVDAELAAILDEQRAAGVVPVVVDRDRLAPEFHVNVAVWDRRCAWTADMNAHGHVIGHVFSVQDRDVRRLREVFETCLGTARR
ncbi:MAG TPA: hypothetical protein VES42_25690 [Pilimelia sp.]|nr:hypothetical protein [Pilimelia sp.]